MLKQFKKKNHKTYYWPSLNRSERTEALHQKGQCSFARIKKQTKTLLCLAISFLLMFKTKPVLISAFHTYT